MRDRIASWYRRGLWTPAKVQSAVGKWITQAEADDILEQPTEGEG